MPPSFSGRESASHRYDDRNDRPARGGDARSKHARLLQTICALPLVYLKRRAKILASFGLSLWPARRRKSEKKGEGNIARILVNRCRVTSAGGRAPGAESDGSDGLDGSGRFCRWRIVGGTVGRKACSSRSSRLAAQSRHLRSAWTERSSRAATSSTECDRILMSLYIHYARQR